MDNIATARRWALVAIAGVALGGALAGCGDDDVDPAVIAAPATTTAGNGTTESAAEWGARVEAGCPEFQPGFDEFYAAHPEPAPADYVEFLPTQIDGLDAMSRCIEASDPPAEIVAGVQAVTDAMDLVVVDFQKALDAAKAGDAETMDEWLTQMHDVDVAKIGQAFDAIGLVPDS